VNYLNFIYQFINKLFGGRMTNRQYLLLLLKMVMTSWTPWWYHCIHSTCHAFYSAPAQWRCQSSN